MTLGNFNSDMFSSPGAGGNFANSLMGMTTAGNIASKQAQQNFGYNSSLQGQNNASQQGMNAADNANRSQIAGMNNDTQRQGNQLQYQASILAPTLKQQRFNTVLPMFQDAYSKLGSTTSGGSPQGTQPTISTGGVYSQNQIQQQVNASRASTDQQTGTNIQNMNDQLGGKGYGSGSPLAMALQQNFQGQGLAANTSNERETRMNAAQQNATQTLNSQQAAEGQYASRQNEDIERNKTKTTALGAWLGSLGSIVG